MTTAPDLNLLEHDLQETRARLARDLDRLRSTETISGFKADLLAQASQTKDELVGKAKDSVSASVRDLWSEMKARAAANPAAALALGLAWRQMQRPPIASALVGIGLLSLWRTDPRHPAPGANLAARSAEFLETAKGKAEDASASVHERGRGMDVVPRRQSGMPSRHRKKPLRQCGNAVRRCFPWPLTARER
jgi:hypothetical protein